MHVIPIEDAIEHEAFPTCWCQPTRAEPELCDAWPVWTHHSADGREALERPPPQFPAATRH